MRAGEEDRSLFYSRGHGSGRLSHSGGLDWSLGEAVGEWETSGKNLASEIAHLQPSIDDFPRAGSPTAEGWARVGG